MAPHHTRVLSRLNDFTEHDIFDSQNSKAETTPPVPRSLCGQGSCGCASLSLHLSGMAYRTQYISIPSPEKQYCLARNILHRSDLQNSKLSKTILALISSVVSSKLAWPVTSLWSCASLTEASNLPQSLHFKAFAILVDAHNPCQCCRCKSTPTDTAHFQSHTNQVP